MISTLIPFFPDVLLENLNIGRNEFSGILPDELLTLTNLTLLDLSDNGFTGTIISGLEKLTKLSKSIFFETTDVKLLLYP